MAYGFSQGLSKSDWPKLHSALIVNLNVHDYPQFQILYFVETARPHSTSITTPTKENSTKPVYTTQKSVDTAMDTKSQSKTLKPEKQMQSVTSIPSAASSARQSAVTQQGEWIK